MTNLPTVDTAHFKENGYLVLRKVFDPSEMLAMREKLLKSRERIIADGQFGTLPATPKAKYLLGDALSYKEIRDHDYVIFDPRIVESVKKLLGPNLVYFGDSSLQTGEGARGFHKDNVDRIGGHLPDWQGDYTILRFGVYYQDHSRHSGGLKVRAKSQNYPIHHTGKKVDIDSQLGDVVMWNLRTTHSGNNVRLKGFPGLVLHPRIEAEVPQFLKVPEEKERVFLSCTFGVPSSHLERYIENQKKRGDYEPYWRHSAIGSELEQLAAARGVGFRRPVDYYGADYKG